MKTNKRQIKEISKYNVVIISGASSGIGECFAEFVLNALNLAQAKAVVFNLSRSATKFDSLEYFNSIKCDLTNSTDLENAVEIIKAEITKVQKPRVLLINNAGFGAYGLFPMPSEEHNLRMIDLNVRALTSLTSKFLPLITANNGAIINIASTASFQACPYLSVYAATKAYVKSFTQAITYETNGKAKCLCVCPGPTSSMFFKTAGFDNAPLPSGFGHKPIDVVSKSFNALAKGKNFIVVGKLNTFQAIITSFIPRGLMLKISGAILKKIRKV